MSQFWPAATELRSRWREREFGKPAGRSEERAVSEVAVALGHGSAAL
jgi:hypothetical protein